MNREQILRRRIKLLTSLFILGLFLSGVTAIPLRIETSWLTHFSHTEWLLRVHAALVQTQSQYPFLFYGTDWLAFGHFVIAIAFLGALKDPVRNRWLFDFGLIACALVIPWALIFGAIRGIPFLILNKSATNPQQGRNILEGSGMKIGLATGSGVIRKNSRFVLPKIY